MEDEPRVSLLNTADNPERARFQQLVENTMKDLATRVSSNQQSSNNQYIKGFATQMTNFTSTQELYGLVQCTPDLSGANCNSCLQVAIATLPECCYGKQGGRVLIPSCNLRYEVYPFYNLTAIPPRPTPPAPSSLTERHVCRNQTTHTPNSTFQSNLNTVLSSLSSNATRNKGFHYSFAGRVSPDIAYGLYLCQQDVASDVCQKCVLKASTEIVEQCPDDKEAIIWYSECMLRYADRSFNSTMEDKPRAYMENTLDIPGRYRSQCTPDLSAKDCTRCIQLAADNVTNTGMTVRVLTPSCNILYEGYKILVVDSTNASSPVMPPPPPSSSSTKPRGKRRQISIPTVVSIVAPICVSLALFGMAYCFIVRRKLRMKKNIDISKEETVAKETSTVKSLQFDFGTIEAATNNFSSEKKIGEGGFGEIYQGVLINGQEIAVKRLSKSSGQGSEEFKNEVSLVAKLQHRNLVRILGFCLQGVEQILIYEYIPNKSLDYILFDPKKQGQLDWSRRHKIIDGIARGLLYLHEDSRLRIVHRDIKASNILLDADMNPKISDFGMARIFQVDQTQGNTSRIVGTYGYMSPEYAMHGEFSVKSDVFSFGVLVLEMITGKKVTSFYQSEHADDLLCYAWKLVRDSTPLELVDPSLKDSYSRVEVLRCIHVGLLCVQEDVDARPSMASVLLMLNNYSVTMPLPQQPPFFTHNRTELEMPEGFIPDQSTMKSMAWSVDESLITGVYPR